MAWGTLPLSLSLDIRAYGHRGLNLVVIFVSLRVTTTKWMPPYLDVHLLPWSGRRIPIEPADHSEPRGREKSLVCVLTIIRSFSALRILLIFKKECSCHTCWFYLLGSWTAYITLYYFFWVTEIRLDFLGRESILFPAILGPKRENLLLL